MGYAEVYTKELLCSSLDYHPSVSRFYLLVVLDTFHENPYRNLIEASDRDVRLTIVEGKAVFGDVDLMNTLQGDDWEYVNGTGFSKAVDVTSMSVEDGTQSWESIESGLAMAMRNEVSDIREHWGEVSDLTTDQEVQEYLDSKFDGDYNDVENQFVIKWNDMDWMFEWPHKNPILFGRDK